MLTLLLLHFVDSDHLVILFNHLIDDSVDIHSLFLIFSECILSQLLPVDHLILDVSFQGIERLLLLIGCSPGVAVSFFLAV